MDHGGGAQLSGAVLGNIHTFGGRVHLACEEAAKGRPSHYYASIASETSYFRLVLVARHRLYLHPMRIPCH